MKNHQQFKTTTQMLRYIVNIHSSSNKQLVIYYVAIYLITKK